MTATAKRWLSRALKFGFCAVAIWYLTTKVSYHDYVRLKADPNRLIRLVAVKTASGGTEQQLHQVLAEWQIKRTKEGRTELYRRFAAGGVLLHLRDPETGHEKESPGSELADESMLEKRQQPIEDGIKTIAITADRAWLGLSILILGPTTFCMAWRLKLLLAVQNIAIGLRESTLLTFAGNFFNFAMPGTTGGDLYKAYHIAKRTHKRTEGVTVVFLDRVIGLISFLILAAVAMLLAHRSNMLGQYGKWVGYLMVVMFIGGSLYFSRRMRTLIRYEALLHRLPFADKLRRIDETAFSFRFHPKQAIAALAVTLVSHGFMVTSIFFLARSLGIGPHGDRTLGEMYLAIMLSVFVGYLFAAVPISIQGFGLLEAVFIRVLVEGGWCSMNQMLALTLGARLVQILWALPGVLVPWLGLPKPK